MGICIYRRPDVRDSTLHMDCRRLAGDLREWLTAHPGWSAWRLSKAAGLCEGYARKVLREDTFEVRTDSARKLLRTMRAIEARERIALREAMG